MNISINKSHMRKVAKELGFEIEFDTDTSGFIDLFTGKHYNYSEIFRDFLSGGETVKHFDSVKKPNKD